MEENNKMLAQFTCLVNYLKARTSILKDEKGQTVVEYALLLVLIALAVFLVNPGISAAITAVFSRTASHLTLPS